MAEAFSRGNVEHDLVTMTGHGHDLDRDMDNPTVKDARAKLLAFLELHTNIRKAYRDEFGVPRVLGHKSGSIWVLPC